MQVSQVSLDGGTRRLGRSLVVLGLALMAGGCAATDISSAHRLYAQGLFEDAADSIRTIHPQDEDGASTKNRSEDNIWLLIEKGKLLLDAGFYDESNSAFLEANRILETLDEEALISLVGIRS